jgi:hypothetical protein
MQTTSFRQQAENCRRLARTITARDDPTVGRLIALSKEFEAKAAAIESEAKFSRLIDSLSQEDALPAFTH